MELSGSRRSAAVSFIFVTVMIDMLTFGIVIPVLPKLILDMSGDASTATHWNAVLGTVWALMQFVFGPILGSLSDRYGRRPVILISNFGLAADFVLLALAPNLWWLLVARILSGVVSASVSTANAYVADVTPPQDRARAFGTLGAAFGVGFVIGPFVGGILGHYDPRLPFWGAAVLAFLNGCYGLFVLPESLPRDRRSGFSWAKANPVGSLRFLLERSQLFGLAMLNFVAQFAHYSLPTIFVLYALIRYGWGPLDAGKMMFTVGICSVIVQGFLVAKIVPVIGERKAAVFGYLFGATGFAIYAWAPQGFWIYVGIPIMSLWGLAGPSVQAMMSRKVEATEQGKLQGMNAGIMALAGLFGPALYNEALDIGQHSHGLVGLPFWIAAALLVLCSAMAAVLIQSKTRTRALDTGSVFE